MTEHIGSKGPISLVRALKFISWLLKNEFWLFRSRQKGPQDPVAGLVYPLISVPAQVDVMEGLIISAYFSLSN